MTDQLKDRRIVVTGAATGIGLSAVRALVAEGADVTAVYNTTPYPAELGDQAHWVRCDLRDKAAVDAAFAAAADRSGGLDVLLTIAGKWAAGSPQEVTGPQFAEMLDLNLMTTVYTNQAAYDAMRDTGGAIVNVGSVEGVAGSPGSAAYAVAKGAVHTWTRSAARAWAPQGIRVNAIAPVMDTTNAQRVRDHIGPEGERIMAERMKGLIPLGGKMGDADTDLAPVLVFLSGEGARFITGQLISIDGGMRMLGA